MVLKYPVSEAKTRDLQERMERLQLKEEDIEESFVKGGGPGGQKINKTSITVLVRHIPTGIEVRCQESRSQAMNRFLGRRMLVEKLEEKFLQEKTKKQKAIEKIRRQKRKRSKRAKEKILEDKKKQSDKKKLRQKPEE